ncbi:npp1 domain-containing protein [Colletotrichum asianum]|uniref:Npp1 domain-containing protein n=1 Tax=Colletotrichum asianum TaxID=702518 RepID=A0A8H3W9J5_9PEZI|nr:npp1 domain-containing protein [Colletotrichum asianum]
MSLQLRIFLLSLFLAVAAGAGDIWSKWKNHNDIVGFPQPQASDYEQNKTRLFKPRLHVWGGCLPYPAVDSQGYLGSGLKPTGKKSGDCWDTSQSGQIYARTGSSHGRDAIIYAWYEPKVRWAKGNSNGHRHYWRSVVVWLTQNGCDFDNVAELAMAGISYSIDVEAYDTSISGKTIWTGGDGMSPTVTDGIHTHPLVSSWGNKNLGPSDVGLEGTFSQPLIDWASLSQPARDALNGVIYEHTKVPFSDANIQGALDAAYNAAFYHGLVLDDCGDDREPVNQGDGKNEPLSAMNDKEDTASCPTNSGYLYNTINDIEYT